MIEQNFYIHKIHRALLKTETGILVTLLLAMVLITVMQIILRNVFEFGVIWVESFVRITVLWLALVGAMISSRSRQHIAIDAFIIGFSEAKQKIFRRITDTFTALVCFIVTYYSFQFVRYEYEDGGLAFASVPNWVCEAIIPFAFLIIACRYLLMAVFGKTPVEG